MTYDFRAFVLQQLLPPGSDPAALQAELQALKCEDGNFKALSLRVQTITNRVFAGCPPAVRVAQEVQAFIEATPLAIQSQLSLHDFPSLNDAVAAAYRKDAHSRKFTSTVLAVAGVDAASCSGGGGGKNPG